MRITLVKKILDNGLPCRSCISVEQRLRDAGQLHRIDRMLMADARDADSPGQLLAAELGMQDAPFFLVEHPDGRYNVYTSYAKFAREVLDISMDDAEENREILDRHNLDFL